MNRRSALRTARTFAIVLPLGAGTTGPEGLATADPVPIQLLDEGDAVAALGAVLRQDPAPHACASVLVRDRPGAPAIVALEWRGSEASAESGTLHLLRRPGTEALAGFRVFEGCAPVPRRMREGRLFLTLVENAAGGSTPSRRIASVEIRPEIWSWRAVKPVGAPSNRELEAENSEPRRAGPADETGRPAVPAGVGVAPSGAGTAPTGTGSGVF